MSIGSQNAEVEEGEGIKEKGNFVDDEIVPEDAIIASVDLPPWAQRIRDANYSDFPTVKVNGVHSVYVLRRFSDKIGKLAPSLFFFLLSI